MAAERGDTNEHVGIYVKTKIKSLEKQDFKDLLSLGRNSNHSLLAGSTFPDNNFPCPGLCQY